MLGAFQNLLTLTIDLLKIALVALNMSFKRFLVLVYGLAFSFPVALVAHNVLQVFIALDIVGAHDVGGVFDDLLGDARLSGYFDGE